MTLYQGMWVERINAAFASDNGRQGTVTKVLAGKAQVNWKYKYGKPLDSRVRNTTVRLEDLKIIDPIVDKRVASDHNWSLTMEQAKQVAMAKHKAASVNKQEG